MYERFYGPFSVITVKFQLKHTARRGDRAEHGGAPREPVGRSAVDATGHDGVIVQADGVCVVSAAAWQAAVGFGGCFPPAAQIALPRSSRVACGRGGGSGGGSQDPAPR